MLMLLHGFVLKDCEVFFVVNVLKNEAFWEFADKISVLMAGLEIKVPEPCASESCGVVQTL